MENKHTDNATVSEGFYVCEHCGRIVANMDAETVQTSNGAETWCTDCVSRDAVECEHCGDLIDITTMETATVYRYYYGHTSETWCMDCVSRDAVECEHCGELYYGDIIATYDVWDGGNVTLCDDCYSDDWYTCEDCGRVVHCDDAVFIDGDVYCPDCAGDHHTSENLEDYNHTRGAVFWNADGTTSAPYDCGRGLYLGIELETDNNDDACALADDIADAYGRDYVCCKRDCSLSCEGVEIVSQPMAPAFVLTSGLFEDIAAIVRRHNGVSYDSGTCGLHIHGSRDYFNGADAVYRLDRIFARFASQLINFSRRDSCSVSRWCNIGGVDKLADIKDVAARKKAWYDAKRYAGRYEAVNNTNGATVEVRLWRGTLNMETFRATVEMTAGLFIVANTITDEFADALTWRELKSLVRYALVRENIPYADLDVYLARRGL